MSEILRYIERHVSYENPVLEEIDRQHADHEGAQPNIGIHVGTLLAWIVRAIRAERVLEFGSCIGYSTVFLATALRSTGGQLVAIESNRSHAAAAEANLKRAGVADIVELIQGDAAELITQLEGPFDLILQDAAKALYPKMLEPCIQKVRLHGVLAADDALFRPMGFREEISRPMDEYNRLVFSDPRLMSTILPIGDGLTLSIRVK